MAKGKKPKGLELLPVLAAIEKIVGDDMCEDWGMEIALNRMRGDKRLMAEKLARVYRLAHAFNPKHSCHSVHESWRKALTAPEIGPTRKLKGER